MSSFAVKHVLFTNPAFILKTSKPTILIVEDEKEIADTLTYALSTEGFDPIWVTSAEQALSALHQQRFSLVVLDVGLPDANGFELLKMIRTSGAGYAHLPCLFLTARNEEIDRIVGLEIGADDYVCKPFSPREVVARIKAILKRSDANAVTDNNHQQTNPFSHLPVQRKITYHNQLIELTKAEYELMSVFLAQTSKVYSRRELIDQVWSNKHPSDDRAIDTHIKTLRAKLKACAPDDEFIVTHRGHGYSFELH